MDELLYVHFWNINKTEIEIKLNTQTFKDDMNINKSSLLFSSQYIIGG
jgi:hypothetical protein